MLMDSKSERIILENVGNIVQWAIEKWKKIFFRKTANKKIEANQIKSPRQEKQYKRK